MFVENSLKNKNISEDNIIKNYEDYIEVCYEYLNKTTFYSKKEYKIKLLELYNEKKYNFKLNSSTIDNIINKWKNTNIKFTKYAALENPYNSENELILWDHRNPIIYIPNKKKEIKTEYFIWTHNEIIARARVVNHYFIDATYHNPKKFHQLLIILFKDIVINEYIPCFFILMSNKYEILYNLIMQSIKDILTQFNNYNIIIDTITTDAEEALVNSIKNNFNNTQRLSCLFHLKQDIILNAKAYGLINKNSKIYKIS